MKYSKIIVILTLSLVILLSCMVGPNSDPPLELDILESSSDPLKEITIECYNMPIFDESKELSIKTIDITQNSYGYGIGFNTIVSKITYTQKINNNKAKFLLPVNITSGKFTTIAFKGAYGKTKKILKINYPKYLSLNKNNSVSGDEITITSTKSFFDEATFTQTKLKALLEQYYYIVWIEGDEDKANLIRSLCNDTDIYKLSNGNYEKLPVTKDYYILDKITPYSVTFKVPPYAKTGTVHIINEKGFVIQGDNSIIVSNGDDYAYYSTSEELVIKE